MSEIQTTSMRILMQHLRNLGDPETTRFTLTGSYAIKVLLEYIFYSSPRDYPNFPQFNLSEDEISSMISYMEHITPNDVDVLFCKTDVGKSSDFSSIMVETIGSFTRKQKVSGKSCTYIDRVTGNSFDLTFAGTRVSYYSIPVRDTDGTSFIVDILDPKKIRDFYKEDLGLKGRDIQKDKMKISALDLIILLLGRDQNMSLQTFKEQYESPFANITPSLSGGQSVRRKLIFD